MDRARVQSKYEANETDKVLSDSKRHLRKLALMGRIHVLLR
jgi:hypothetical protein